MASYVITGVSRGLGFEFLRQLSENPANKVIGLVRNKASTEASIAKEIPGRENIFIIEADIANYNALAAAAAETAKITGGGLDCIIANAALVSKWSAFDGLGVLGKDHVHLEADLLESFSTNVVGNIHLFNLFVPLLKKGNLKKAIVISSGMADNDLVAKYDIEVGGPYSISKAAVNAAVAKFAAEYRKDGILFLSICPGFVETGHTNNLDEHQAQAMGNVAQKFGEYAPHFTGPAQPQDSVRDVLNVISNASIEAGNSGDFISHLGTKRWL